jgi:hypothetical protein
MMIHRELTERGGYLAIRSGTGHILVPEDEGASVGETRAVRGTIVEVAWET